MSAASTPASRLVLCLCGPTATGKTGLAIELARHRPLHLISVDSALVYRGLDIGTGKPDAALREEVPHALIDIRDPWESYSAGEFRSDALREIRRAHEAGKVPLLVGGTMLYFRALLAGIADLPSADPAVRAAIDAEADRAGWPALHERLQRIDPAIAARIDPADRQRIQRALEVHELTGQPLSLLQTRKSRVSGIRFEHIALIPGDRQVLYQRIERRLDAMLADGFVEEVDRIRQLPGMSPACPALRAVGYRQLWIHLTGGLSLPEARRQAVIATRRLAKRQLTWLRSESPGWVLDSEAPDLWPRLALAVDSLLDADAKRPCRD